MTRERAILAFLRELEGRGLHGFLLTLRGETLAEGYCAPFGAEQMHRLYSVSKSVVSLAIGLLADEGRLSLDDPIVRYFPEWVAMTGRSTARSGTRTGRSRSSMASRRTPPARCSTMTRQPRR